MKQIETLIDEKVTSKLDLLLSKFFAFKVYSSCPINYISAKVTDCKIDKKPKLAQIKTVNLHSSSQKWRKGGFKPT